MNLALVEDDESIRLGLKYYLEDEGFSLTSYKDAESFLESIPKNHYDLLLLDINLPGMSGFEALPKIKEKDDIPVIFLTANDLEVSTVMGLDMGADDYITKPFKAKELVSRIKSVLRRTSTSCSLGQSTIKIQNITIDTTKMKVLKDGKDVFLTALEYKILLILALNPTTVFTREKILSNIWDVNEEYVNDNALTVYVRRIREKIEDDLQNPKIIVTVRGIGYKLGNRYE